MKLLVVYLALALTCLDQLVSSNRIINCQFGTRSNNRHENGKLESSNLDPKLCTRISYSSFGINESGEIKSLSPLLDFEKGLIKKTIALKQKNPKLKVVAVVDGWNEESTKYWAMVADSKKRATFVSSTLLFIRKYGFDGLDLEFEYPGQQDGSKVDQANFLALLKEITEAFDPYGLELNIALRSYKPSASIDSGRIGKMMSNRACINGELSKHDSDCSKFYQCAHGQLVEMSCPNGLNYNNDKKQCDWPSNVTC